MKQLSIILLLVSGILFIQKANAQQQGQYSQYMLNYFNINPASIGVDDYVNIRGGYRQQWSGLPGAPKNYYLTAHSPLNKIHPSHIKKFHNKIAKPHHFIGAALSGQQLGAFSVMRVYATYGYNIPLTKKWNLSMASSIGLIQYKLDVNRLDFGDEVVDPASTYTNAVKPDLGLGIWLSSKQFFAGISTMQLFENKLGSKGVLNHHFYFTTGYSFELNRDWSFIPSVMLSTVPFIALQTDVNMKLKFQNMGWVGISYRKSDAIAFLVGFNLYDSMTIGYSYDFTTSHLNKHSNGSHEIMLSLKLVDKMRIISPSDFW